jgi:hypothetical protein
MCQVFNNENRFALSCSLLNQPGDHMAKLPSRRIYLLFSWCAWLVVATGVFVAWFKTPFFAQFNFHSWLLFPVALVAALLVLFGIPAAFILWGAMGYYCSLNSRISKGARFAWFLLFFTTGWYGSALYFFTVYRREAVAALRLPRSDSPEPVQSPE